MPDLYSPFEPVRKSQIKDRWKRIEEVFNAAGIALDELTVNALILVLHAAAKHQGVPMLSVINALATLDGAVLKVNVADPEPTLDGDEPEQLIGGKPH